MKSFNEFLVESKKQYNFRLKIAGSIANKQLDSIETALDKWGLVSLTTPKTTPIQKTSADFPLLKDIEVTILDFVLDYPVTSRELHIRINQCTDIPFDYINVFPEKEEINAIEDSPVLTKPYPKSEEKKNPHYGDKFIKEFLKKEKNVPYEFKIAGGKEKNTISDNLVQNTKSPIGSKEKAK